MFNIRFFFDKTDDPIFFEGLINYLEFLKENGYQVENWKYEYLNEYLE